MCSDQDQFIEQLYRACYGKLTMYAAASLRSQNKAQDIVQDTFHDAILRADLLMQHPNPFGWLMVTVKYKVLEEKRKQTQDMLRFLSLETDLFAEPGQRDPGLEQMSDAEEVPVLEQIQRALTPEEYLLLKRLTIDQASHAEVAQEFGISVYASQKRLERIRKKLKKRFPQKF